MCLRKNVVEQKQMSFFEFKGGEISEEIFYERGDEFLSLLEEVLSEVFTPVEDKESYLYLENSSIYDLTSENELLERVLRDELELNEDSPALDEFEKLLKEAEKHFESRGRSHAHENEDANKDWITGFIQILHGQTYDQFGKISEGWRSIGNKIIIPLSDLDYPEKIEIEVRKQGFKWDKKVLRVVFYGEPIAAILYSRSYIKRERRELIPLCKSYENIFLCIPSHCQSRNYFDRKEKCELDIASDLLDLDHEDELDSFHFASSIYLFSDSERSIDPDHDEVTKEDLDYFELREETERFLHEWEKSFTKSDFGGTKEESTLYSHGRDTSKGLSNPSELRDILRDQALHESVSLNEKNIPAAFPLNGRTHESAKLNVVQFETALKLINDINAGRFVDIQLLGFLELNSIFHLLWNDRKFQIIPQRKDTYFQLKERFLRLRPQQQSFSHR